MGEGFVLCSNNKKNLGTTRIVRRTMGRGASYYGALITKISTRDMYYGREGFVLLSSAMQYY